MRSLFHRLKSNARRLSAGVALCACFEQAAAQQADSRPAPPFDGLTLSGWRALGDAVWTVEDGAIRGRVGGGAQSFLVSERTWADFELELELCNDAPGNSGVQIRSHVNEQGRLYGYQIEIDPSARAWSGGLYDEGRRGWLDDLADDEKARAAFRGGEWNRYRIVCDGPWIRAWVNGVATADRLDPLDLDGHFALQVHSGRDTNMRWRGLALVERGAHRWVDVAPEGNVELVAGRGALRIELAADARGALALVEVTPNPAPRAPVHCGAGLVRTSDGWRVDADAAELRGAADAPRRELCWIAWDGRHALFVDGRQVVDWRAEQGWSVPARFTWSGATPARLRRLEREPPRDR
ncbi:MAG: DUF1080 domain-containing protein [Planctomycetes bacterium]|nr:DUF1080 domain-containing protein [Planctomycetota bacterium]